ncbi:MAG TPA: hypothetical protein VFK05_07300 [Polyangiaceae bacterium]|nr:hypothetical protein [Polyangiaceae bacterium]
MPHLGFDVRDYSTHARVGNPPDDDLLVVVSRRNAALPPLTEGFDSSVRLRERRLYFGALRSASGFVVLPDVPPGNYPARIVAHHYVPFATNVTSPQLAPLAVALHRDAAFPFAPEDTLIRGRVRTAGGLPHTGFDVRLSDLTEASVPNHRVPLNAAGDFVIFIPEKQTTGGISVEVFHAGGSVVTALPAVQLHRSNWMPPIIVP